jgi:hypothetical protein
LEIFPIEKERASNKTWERFEEDGSRGSCYDKMAQRVGKELMTGVGV